MARKTELFSYLPPMTEEEVSGQVRYVLDRGYIAGIEYTESLDVSDDYWRFWKLPFFNGTTTEEILRELGSCREAHPKAYIRLTGYDPKRQCQVLSFVVQRPEGEN